MAVVDPLTTLSTGAARAEALDRHMGDPHDPRLPWSFHRSVERDEREEFASDVYRVIDDVAWKPPLPSRADQALIARTIARRDPGMAFAWACSAAARDVAGPRLGAAPRGPVALLLPVSSVVVARPHAQGFCLSGDCPLVPNLRHAATAVIEADLADTGRRAVFAADRATISQAIDRVRTVGLRTADIAATRLSRCLLPAEACVTMLDCDRDRGAWAPGVGADTTAVSAAYVMAAAVSLGIADTALRAAVEFARSRAAYGRTVFDIPHVRALVADAATDLIVGECTLNPACDAARAWFHVNRAVESVLRNARVVLGARGYCRDGYWNGIVEKLTRDHMVLRAYPTAPGNIASREVEDRLARAIARLENEAAALTDGLDRAWLAAALDRLDRRRRPLSARLAQPPSDSVLSRLLDLYESGRSFSLRPIKLVASSCHDTRPRSARSC
jgi:hypothetical protein